MKQTDRLERYLRAHPLASSLEITLALGIVNVTGRVSDLRKTMTVVCEKRPDGNLGYRIVDPEPVQVAAFFAEDVA
ncbi:MAG: hypothetical protein ABIN55_09140 [Aeromicrobium sp.]